MNKFLSLILSLTSTVVLADVVTKPAAGAAAKPTEPSVGSNAPIKLDRSKITNRIKLQFDEDLVKGNAENTELNFIQTRKENAFKKMIKIRENFIPEIESSASELGSK